mmetsp:Transcript_16502/g.51197  ORF Transcript_16502/g.51197 Transcript_16502/m.51197 type:complete len:237 (-) Transcript_16502:86-796(-)
MPCCGVGTVALTSACAAAPSTIGAPWTKAPPTGTRVRPVHASCRAVSQCITERARFKSPRSATCAAAMAAAEPPCLRWWLSGVTVIGPSYAAMTSESSSPAAAAAAAASAAAAAAASFAFLPFLRPPPPPLLTEDWNGTLVLLTASITVQFMPLKALAVSFGAAQPLLAARGESAGPAAWPPALPLCPLLLFPLSSLFDAPPPISCALCQSGRATRKYQLGVGGQMMEASLRVNVV